MIKNIINQQCPRCRKGKLFKHGAYNLKSFAVMHDECPCCGQRYHLEPSFYYGALYVSYGLQVMIFASVSVALYVLFDNAPLSWYLIGVTALALILFPLVFRLSRSIWIHIFVKFDPSKADCNPALE